MHIKISKLMNFSWIFFGASISTLPAVDSLRVNLGFITLPMPVLIIIIIMILSPILYRKKELTISKTYLSLIIISYFLLMWSSLSIIMNINNYGLMSNYQVGLKELVKLTMSITVFIYILAFFKPDKKFIENFWKVVLWSSTLVLGFFIIRSLANGNLFLSTSMIDMTERLGRNVTGWFASMLFPFALVYLFLCKGIKNKMIHFIPFSVILFAAMYSLSRSAWIMCVISIFTFLWFVSKVSPKIAIRAFFIILLISISMIIGIASIVDDFYIFAEFLEKLLWFTNITSGTETYNTFDQRFTRIFDALNIFSHYPVFGVGMGNFVHHPLSLGGQAHNDYALILGETGIAGLILIFLLIIISLICLRNKGKFQGIEKVSWTYFASKMTFFNLIFSMLFVDAYRTPQVWIFLSLVLITIRSCEEYFVNFEK